MSTPASAAAQPAQQAGASATAPGQPAQGTPAAQPATGTPATRQAGTGAPATQPGTGTPATEMGRPGSRMPRDLRRLRNVTALACVATGLAATGYLGLGGIEGGPAALADHVADAGRAGTEVARSGLQGAEVLLAETGGEDTGAPLDSLDSTRSGAATALAAAAGGTGADAALREAGGSYVAYVASLERARAQAADDPEAATASAVQAQTVLDEQVLAPLEASGASAVDRVGGTRGGILAANVGIVSTLLLLGGSVWLARKTHRVVNPGLAGATVITGAITALALNPGSLPGDATEAVNAAWQDQTTVSRLYEARTLDTTLALPGAEAETLQARWDETVTELGSGLADAPTEEQNAWQAYLEAHEQLVAAEDGAGRAEALTAGDDAMASLLEWAQSRTDAAYTGLQDDVGRPAVITSGASLVLGLVAAGLAWSGINRRLRDYR